MNKSTRRISSFQPLVRRSLGEGGKLEATRSEILDSWLRLPRQVADSAAAGMTGVVWLLFIAIVCVSASSLWAAEQTPPPTPSNVIIVDGKKFFLLNNVKRHMNTGASSATFLHPRAQPLAPVKANITAPPSTPPSGILAKPATSTPVAAKPAATSTPADALLSVFEPEAHPSAAAAAPSTKQ